MKLYGSKNLYIGEVRCACNCHGFWRGYSLKIKDVISITFGGHRPWIWILTGTKAKIDYGTPDAWKMWGDRIDRA